MKIVLLALDGQANQAVQKAVHTIRTHHGVDLTVAFHLASELDRPAAVERLRADAADAAVFVAVHQFADEQVSLIHSILREHGDRYEAVVCMMSAPSLIKRTRLGKFVLGGGSEEKDAPWYSPLRMIKAVKNSLSDPAEEEEERKPFVPGRAMLTMLKNAGKIMKFIPGKARDISAYMEITQYWLNSSAENLTNLFLFLMTRYTRRYQGKFKPSPPREYPEVGLYHPRLDGVTTHLKDLHRIAPPKQDAGTVGVLMLRSYLLSENRAHYDAVIHGLERRGLNVIPAYAFGLDGRPAVEKYFFHHGRRVVDAVVSLTGFSLVGGPAYNDAHAAEELMKTLDVPYYCCPSLEFQTTEEWFDDPQGLNRVQATLMVALPELDGATDPIIYAGKTNGSRLLSPIADRVERLAGRIAQVVALRRAGAANRRVAIVLFNFPPSQGNTGTAAYLDVFPSLHRLLAKMRADGYRIDNLPETVDDLRDQITKGNARELGTPAHVGDFLSVRRYEAIVPDYRDIEREWGPAPGEKNNNGDEFFIFGREYGNVAVFVQPGFGYEDDPMRLLFSQNATPNHSFAAFYGYLRQVWKADALLHFGTHGAMEFMPGKQVGMSSKCWPDRLLGDMPNFYVYCANNPSEGLIAKRRGHATLVSYLNPPIEAAGLYKEFVALKDVMDGYRSDPERADWYVPPIVEKAKVLNLLPEHFEDSSFSPETFRSLYAALLELEYSLIPTGLHTLGESAEERDTVETLRIMADFPRPEKKLESLTDIVRRALGRRSDHVSGTLAELSRDIDIDAEARVVITDALREMFLKDSTHAGVSKLTQATGVSRHDVERHFQFLHEVQRKLQTNNELEAIRHALAGGFIAPVAGGDLTRDPGVLPTGRNIHAIDPYRLPTTVAAREAKSSVAALLDRYLTEQDRLPESVALVLWGTDNLKTGGVGIAQALWLIGAEAVMDEMGRICDIELVPLDKLGRPRIDVVLTISGIFRDLLPQQMRLLDRAVRKAAEAPEPFDLNFIRLHVHEQMTTGVPFETAVLRIFSNAPGSYGANINHLVDSSTWEDEGEITQMFLTRKGFAYLENGGFVESKTTYESALSKVGLTFQNIDSTEMNITDIDHYYEYLGGVSKAVKQLRDGEEPTVMLGDSTSAQTKIRSLDETVRLETRTKLLNPKWYEGMLKHGYSGVAQIEQHVSNTYGWSATCDAVDNWVYDGVAKTYVLDEAMRHRLQQLNPDSLAKMTRRLLEANGRGFWETDDQTLDQLRELYAQMEDALENVEVG